MKSIYRKRGVPYRFGDLCKWVNEKDLSTRAADNEFRNKLLNELGQVIAGIVIGSHPDDAAANRLVQDRIYETIKQVVQELNEVK